MDRGSTSTSIYLAWSQQPDDFIKRVNITAAYTGPCANLYSVIHNTSLSNSTRQFNLTGLEEYSNYSIIVTAVNDAGSNLSQVLNITTRSSGKFIKHYFLTVSQYTLLTSTQWTSKRFQKQLSKSDCYHSFMGSCQLLSSE